jgi:MFS family permease
LPFTYLYFSLPIISKAFGASAVEIGGLFTIFTGTTLLIRPIIGLLLDRTGRKAFFVLSLVIYAISMGVFAFAESMTWLYLARSIQGIGSAFLWSAVNTIVADLTPPEGRGKAIGKIFEIITRGGLFGILAALVPMMIFPNDISWKIIFCAYTISTLVAAGLAWKNVPSTHSIQPSVHQKTIFSHPLLHLLFIVFITGIPEAMLSPIYLIYLQDKFTTDISMIAWAFFPAGLITAFLGSRLGELSDRFGRVPMMAAGMLGSGIIYLIMPGIPSLILLAVVYAFQAMLWGLSEPAETALVAELTGRDQIGFGYGVYDFVENVGFAVGPLLGGILYDTLGRSMPFYLNGIILIFSAGWVMVFLYRKANPAPHLE